MLKYTISMKNKIMAGAAALSLAAALSGCQTAGENTASAMQSIQNLDYQSALASFEEAQAKGENERMIYRGMGIAYMGLTDYAQAAVCFENAIRLSRGLVESMDYDLNFYLAAAYTKSGQPEAAESTYNAILAMQPGEADAYFLRGNVRLSLGKYEDAQADFDKVVSMDPQNYDRMIQIYEVLSNYGYTEAGQLYLQNALQKEDGKMSAYDKGLIYYFLGDYQQAAMQLEAAKEKGGAQAYLYLGKAYEATGDYNYAASVYNTYLSKDTSNAEIYNQLGLCEIAKGNYENALAAFQGGLSVENNTMMQTLSFNEIVAYEHLGDFKKAAVLMETYLQNYPDDEKAKREYGFLQTR